MIVLGSSNVGKSSLVHRLASKLNEITPSSVPIMGDYLERMAAVNGQKQLLKMQLWDTAGQSKFAALPNSYFRHARGAILVYDVTSRRSFREILSEWIPQLERSYSNSSSPFALTLVATKCDVDGARRQVSVQDGEWLAKVINADNFFELSTSSDAGACAAVDRCFSAIANSIADCSSWAISPEAAAAALEQLRAAKREAEIVAVKTEIVPVETEATVTISSMLQVKKPKALTISTEPELALSHTFQSSKLRSPSVHCAPEDYGASSLALLLRVDSTERLALVSMSALLALTPVLLLLVLVLDSTGAVDALGAIERIGAFGA